MSKGRFVYDVDDIATARCNSDIFANKNEMYWCVNSSSKLVSFLSWKLIPDYCSIGYPVVTLGFGFKSYVGYRMKQRRQKEIQKENETYYSLLREVRSECSWRSMLGQVGTWLNLSYENYINLNTSISQSRNEQERCRFLDYWLVTGCGFINVS